MFWIKKVTPKGTRVHVYRVNKNQKGPKRGFLGGFRGFRGYPSKGPKKA